MTTTNAMCGLHLPEGADGILTHVQELLPAREGTRLLVYGLSDVTKDEDVDDLCQTATEMYANEIGEDADQDARFITAAPQDRRLPGKTVQDVLNAHVFSLHDYAYGDGDQLWENEAIFPFAFVVIESSEWRRHGATVVLVDNAFDPDNYWDDRPPEGFWWTDETEVSVVGLGGLCHDLVMEQDDWHNIKECQGRPTARTGGEDYNRTRSRSWSPPGISSTMSMWSSGRTVS